MEVLGALTKTNTKEQRKNKITNPADFLELLTKNEKNAFHDSGKYE